MYEKKTMKKFNYLIISLALMISLLAILPNISATIAMISPATNSNQSANFVTNWTFANVTDGVTNVNTTNSTFYWNATGSWVLVTKSNFVCSATNCLATLAISSMGEGVGVLNFTAGNDTALGASTLSGQFRVDKTAPTVSITSSKSQIYQRESNVITWSATDAGSGLSSTVVTITSLDTANCPTLSYSTATGSVTLTESQTQCVGVNAYTASIVSTDLAGNSASSSSAFNVLAKGGTVVITDQQAKDINSSGSKTNYLPIAIIIIILAIVLFFIFKKK